MFKPYTEDTFYLVLEHIDLVFAQYLGVTPRDTWSIQQFIKLMSKDNYIMKLKEPDVLFIMMIFNPNNTSVRFPHEVYFNFRSRVIADKLFFCSDMSYEEFKKVI